MGFNNHHLTILSRLIAVMLWGSLSEQRPIPCRSRLFCWVAQRTRTQPSA